MADFSQMNFKIDFNMTTIKEYIYQYCRLDIQEIVAIQMEIIIYNKTPQTRTYFSKQRSSLVLMNEVFMTFSGCVSYCKDSYHNDEHIQ